MKFMTELEHGEDCQHEHDHEHVHGIPVHWAVLGVSFFLVILATMFLIGMALGRGAQLADTGNPSGETEGIINEVITLGLQVTWLPVEQHTPYSFNATLRTWFDKESLANDNGQGISYEAVQVGSATLDGAEYRLMAETVGLPAMGDDRRTFYLLEHAPTNGEKVKEPVLLMNYNFFEPGFGPTGSVTKVEWPVTAADGLVVSYAKIEALETQGNVDATSLGFAKLIGIGILPTVKELGLLRQYAVVGTLENGRALRVYDGTISVDSAALNELFTFGDDGRVIWYNLSLPFYTLADENIDSQTFITWNDGTVATEQYTPQLSGGCGHLAMTNVVSDPPVLAVAGFVTTDHSMVIYEPADFADPALNEDFMNWRSQHADGTMEQFAASHPYFYFKDALGRYVKLTRTDVISPGECGKPVIYLYPTKTTDINVQLSPVGGFTKTEPAYGEGWNVTASPDGSLVNKADGETYPYLFWEGRGGFYAEPKYFDVIAKADVDQYLTMTLAKYGLNAQEMADFKEFWLPRMQSADYYKIGWHGTSVMNALAPLHLSLAPQTLIRILMDYTELSSPVVGKPLPSIATPERQGFTVVEWGGVLR